MTTAIKSGPGPAANALRVQLSDETLATVFSISLTDVPSHPVTNAGTFAVQVTSAPSIPVTGTFWQATQPVSLASVPSHAVTNAGTFAVQNTANVFWNDSVVAQAAAATVTGTARDVGVAAAAVHRYSYFNASAYSDQAGTLRLECSNDNTTWRRASADTALAAGTVVTLSTRVMTRYYRAVYVNGATLQGAFMLNTSFTAS